MSGAVLLLYIKTKEIIVRTVVVKRRKHVARIRLKPEEFEYDIEQLKSGTEYTVNIFYYYYPGQPQTYDDPECPAEIEIVKVEHVAGGYNEVEWEMDRQNITEAIMEEGDEHDAVVQAIFDHIDSEADRFMAGEYS